MVLIQAILTFVIALNYHKSGDMPNVAVDIGNTRIKAALFTESAKEPTYTCKGYEDLLDHYGRKEHQWIFGSVSDDQQVLKEVFSDEDVLILDHNTPLPIRVNYDTPETLGVDRLAAAAGAAHQFPKRNVLVIDCGTCITYDIIDSAGIFQGGVIAPGLTMRMKAMSDYTRRLPDISSEMSQIMLKNLGKSTRECLLAGSLSASVHEIDGFISSFLKEYDQLVVMMTGGDTNHFESKVKAPIFADFDLVLTGLNRILIKNQ